MQHTRTTKPKVQKSPHQFGGMIEQAEADVWLALHKTVKNDVMGCVTDPLNPDERELYTALTTKLKVITGR